MLRVFDSQRYSGNEVFATQSASTFAASYSVNATTDNSVGSINSKSTCKTAVAATTQNSVGNIQSASGIFSVTQVSATTANAVGTITSRSVAGFSGALSPEDIAAIADAVYARFLLGAIPANVKQVNDEPILGDGRTIEFHT